LEPFYTAPVFITGGTGYIGRRVATLLVARGHRVRLLVRPGSEHKVPGGCESAVGNPLDCSTFAHAIARGDTLLQLLGVPHPSPAKARQFVEIDLRSATESVTAAAAAGVEHFVYVSVAQPAPVMHAYQQAREQAELALAQSGLRRTIVRPWYVLGPGHRWPYALLPLYWILERIPATRDGARRLGLVTLEQMSLALLHAIEHPPDSVRLVEVPEIRSIARRRSNA
jgi:uncharacterized protein YbjT (DUF2867 family)